MQRLAWNIPGRPGFFRVESHASINGKKNVHDYSTRDDLKIIEETHEKQQESTPNNVDRREGGDQEP